MKPKLAIREFYWYSHILISRKPVWPTVLDKMLKSKDNYLKYNKGNFNAVTKLPEGTSYEISWWKKNIFKAFKPIRYPKISITIYRDALLELWGASMGNVSTGGAWLPNEKLMHINEFH